jgi:hypothetical protein
MGELAMRLLWILTTALTVCSLERSGVGCLTWY